MKMKIKNALKNEEISYQEFRAALIKANLGFWDGINDTEIIKEYVKEMMEKDIMVSHIVSALENESCETDDWAIWLGNSMETPSPINNKQDLFNALDLCDKEMELVLNF